MNCSASLGAVFLIGLFKLEGNLLYYYIWKILRDILFPCKIYLFYSEICKIPGPLLEIWYRSNILKKPKNGKNWFAATAFLPCSLHPQIKWTSFLPIFYNLPSMNGAKRCHHCPNNSKYIFYRRLAYLCSAMINYVRKTNQLLCIRWPESVRFAFSGS